MGCYYDYVPEAESLPLIGAAVTILWQSGSIRACNYGAQLQDFRQSTNYSKILAEHHYNYSHLIYTETC